MATMLTWGPRRARLGPFVLVAALLALLTACAPPSPPSPSGPAAADPAVSPVMVMVTLGDLGFRASTLDVPLDGPAMVMVVNRGVAAHQLTSALPLRGLEVADTAAPTAAPSPGPASGFSVSVVPGHEVDVSFTAIASGLYPIQVDGRAAGAFAVTS